MVVVVVVFAQLMLSQAIHAWATVHRGGIHHMSHTHPDHMVSGVYYVAVPPQAGGIIFSDPRGRFPPFDETLTITPKVRRGVGAAETTVEVRTMVPRGVCRRACCNGGGKPANGTWRGSSVGWPPPPAASRGG